MKQQYLISAFTALVAAKVQVELSHTCAGQMMSCLISGMLKASCKLSDLRCACINQVTIKEDMVPCIESACSADEHAYFVSLKTSDHCEDFDASIHAASGSFSAALLNKQTINEHITTIITAYPSDEPSFTGTVIISPNEPTTPCDPSFPIPTETSAITTSAPSPPYPIPSVTETPPLNGTGGLTPTPTQNLPVFTDAAGDVKVGGVAVGLMMLGVML